MEISEKILKTLEFDAVRNRLKNYAKSLLGRGVADRLVPFDAFEKADRALKQVEEMKTYLLEEGRFPFQGAADAVGIIQAARENNKSIDPEELYKVGAMLTCARLLALTLREGIEERPELARLLDRLEDLEDLEAEIQRTVDARGQVQSSASPQLADIRREIEQLTQQIRRKAEGLISERELARYLQDDHIRIRNGKVVLPVRTECRHQVRGILHGYSASGNTVFIEPEILVEKQNTLEKRKVYETREINKILWERTRRLMDLFEEVRNNQRVLAWLDFTFARARFSLDYDLRAPQLTLDRIFVLREARHPLLLAWSFERAEGSVEQRRSIALEEIVPFHLHLGDRFDLLVITGPNTGGKTVTLKSAGLIALMAASGLHVPVQEGTKVPYFSTILADIGDEQDLSQNLSTFSSHMQRISEILEKADERSLVLIDELGTGTDPLEGEALGRAILKFLKTAQANVLVSTHLSKLKEFAYSQPRVENACMEFDPDSLMPTFNLRIGMPGESNAIVIARRLGIAPAILEDAEEALAVEDGQLKALMDDVQRIRIQTERTLEKSRSDAVETERLKEVMAEKEREIAFRMSKLETEAEREIDECLRKGREEALAWVNKLKNLPDPHKTDVRALEETLDRMLERSPLGVKRRKYLESLKKGDEVYIPRYREKCRVLKVYRKEDCVEVAYRNLAVKVPAHEVMWPHWY
ncbi:MAG: endonuclease MutS2 [Planctomycetota bacterium]|jgi:DNA mismatch repair protein MutS2